jgi:hypothetical protein
MTDQAQPIELQLIVSPLSAATTKDELEEITLELKDEIEQSNIFGVSVNETQKHNAGTLGPEWLPVLAAILSAPVAIEATKGLVTIALDWLRRRKLVGITLKGPKGEYVIKGEGLTGDEIAKVAAKIV